MELIEGIPTPPGYQDTVSERFALAVDLGQSVDPTAIAVIEHRRTERMHWKGKLTDERETFDVRYLQRLPLGLSYVAQVEEVSRLLDRPPLKSGCEFVVDATGVGRAVADLFKETGRTPDQVTITAGEAQTRKTAGVWHVPKTALVSALDARLHTGELRFASGLREAGAMAEELKDFRRKVSSAGRFSYDARVGKHDDLVLAVALALWSLIGKPKVRPIIFGNYSDISSNTTTW